MLKSLKNMFGNNKEIENLNQVISEKDNKITELQTNLNKLIEENNNLKQLIPNDSKQIIQLREQLDAMEKLADVKKTNIASLNSNIENLKSIILDYESQKKEIARLWAYEDYELADEETAIVVTRAQEKLNEAQNNLQKHVGTTIPYTSDEERQNAWNQYNGWKNKLYQTQDKYLHCFLK